jgi:predicted metalloprotease with PDZ domain
MISSSRLRTAARTLWRSSLGLALALCLPVGSAWLSGAAPIRYRFTFPEPEHHWMQVEAVFSELGAAPLELRMSRSSPGRYSLHDFAKNVYDVRAFAGDGRELETTTPDSDGWTVPRHDGTVTVRYKVFGDRVDGTYLGIDATHAHLNMPASIMWARGLDDRPSTLRFEPPSGARWHAATQLHPGPTPFEFTAPNLQYLMDSPTELGPIALRQFSVGNRTFRFALHHTGTDAEVDLFVKDVEKIVREQGEIFGEYPDYEPGSYTFLVDYLPWADADGMEHRNSTVITSPSSLRADRVGLLDTVAHEFFHGWNVERIRPRSLEPFDFDRANPSGELWLGEGFTQYYGPLTLSRTGLSDLASTVETMAGLVRSVVLNPAHKVRSAEEMSRMAVFTDGGRTVDRTNWYTTYISYYPFGGAIALALDLTLRARSDGRITLDDYMRAMWRIHGRPGGALEGHVDRPYTVADAEARLAEVSGDREFAQTFFARYIRGREAVDYAPLLERAGLLLRKPSAGRAWWGDTRLELRLGGVWLAEAPLFDTPLYKGGLDLGDGLKQIEGSRVTSPEEVHSFLRRRKPGDSVLVSYVDRAGVERKTSITLQEEPQLELVPIETTGRPLTAAQKAFRAQWLN